MQTRSNKKGKHRTAEHEYEDAPSGYVTLYNYKEPFMEFYDTELQTGYGYQGVLLQDGDTGHCQCHFCGEWHYYLPSHIAREHNMRAADYKERVGLRKTSALISEKTREKLIQDRAKSLKNLTAGVKHTDKTKKKISKALKGRTRETQNQLNTCPDQLIKRYDEVKDKLGRRPRVADKEVDFEETARAVYGSWRNFLKACGEKTVIINQFYEEDLYTGEKIKRDTKPIVKITKETMLSEGIAFYKRHNRLPTCSDSRRRFINFAPSTASQRFGSWANYKKEIHNAIK